MLFICIVTLLCWSFWIFAIHWTHWYNLIIYLQASCVSSLQIHEVRSFFHNFLVYGTYNEIDVMFSLCAIENYYAKRLHLLELLSFCPYDQYYTVKNHQWCGVFMSCWSFAMALTFDKHSWSQDQYMHFNTL